MDFDYVTVVAVDNGINNLLQSSHRNVLTTNNYNNNNNLPIKVKNKRELANEDSQFITVLSINDTNSDDTQTHNNSHTYEETLLEPEIVLVYRLPGERLGFGLRFHGGTKQTEKIQQLFIQSCSPNSPASRVVTSWGNLREGDEIITIDGLPVNQMTRIECVRFLKESNVAIKLLVRNGEGRLIDENGEVISNGGKHISSANNSTTENSNKNLIPPPPPPVPPRKINKKKQKTSNIDISTTGLSTGNNKGNVENLDFTPPPDAEFYLNLFSDETDFNLRGSESDDTGSTISTVIDKFSICSSMGLTSQESDNGNGQSASANQKANDLAKVLRPFQMIEKEFYVDSSARMEDCLLRLQPPVSFQDIEEDSVSTAGDTIAKKKPLTLKMPESEGNVTLGNGTGYENIQLGTNGGETDGKAILPVGQQNCEYENVEFQMKVERRRSSGDGANGMSSKRDYENINIKQPPKPLPRSQVATTTLQQATVEIKQRRRTAEEIIPPHRLSGSGRSKSQDEGFTTIQHWLQDSNAIVENVHECALVTRTTSNSSSSSSEAEEPPQDENNALSKLKELSESAGEHLPRLIDFLPKTPTNGDANYLKKCIKITSADDDETYPSSSSEDEMMERIYEPNAENGEHRAFTDGLSDEEGEKLGPPDIVNGPGPSEAFFNFHWSPSLLPTIGEVEEEFSSLEHQPLGPIVIINAAEEDDSLAEGKITSTTTTATETTTVESQVILINKNYDKHSGNGKQIEQQQQQQHKQLEHVKEIKILTKTPVIPDTSKHQEIKLITKKFNGINTSEENNQNFNEINEKSVKKMCEKNNIIYDINHNESHSISRVIVGTGECIEDTQVLQSNEQQQIESINETLKHQTVDKKVKENLDKAAKQQVVTPAKNTSKSKSIIDKTQQHQHQQKQQDDEKLLIKNDENKLNDRNKKENVKTEKEDELKKVNKEQNNINNINNSSNSINSNNKSNSNTSVNDDDNNNNNILIKKSPIITTTGVGLTKMERHAGSVTTSSTTTSAIQSTGKKLTESSGSIIATIKTLESGEQLLLPTFSRLPPDGHEFPPNFSEPILIQTTSSIVTAMVMPTIITTETSTTVSTTTSDSFVKIKDTTVPPLPKSIPPPIVTPRKIYRQDLIIKVDGENCMQKLHELESVVPFDSQANKWQKNGGSQTCERLTLTKQNSLPSSNIKFESSDTTSFLRKEKDLNIMRRRSVDSNGNSTGISRLGGTSWRKDEKSERSVRDKIAMFSNGEGPPLAPDLNNVLGTPPIIPNRLPPSLSSSTTNRRSTKNRSYENLLDEPDSHVITLSKKAMSVEYLDEKTNYDDKSYFSPKSHLDKYDKAQSIECLDYIVKTPPAPIPYNSTITSSRSTDYKYSKTPTTTPSSDSIKSKHTEQETSPNGHYASLPRRATPTVARTISFSAYGNNQNSEEHRRSSISNMLEQRKKSMSKLRGLVIPEKVAVTNTITEPVLFDLPEIKSKERQKALNTKNPTAHGRNHGLTLSSFNKQRTAYNSNSEHKTPSTPQTAPAYCPQYQPIPFVESGGYKSIFGSNNKNSTTSTKSPKAPIVESLIVKKMVVPEKRLPPPLPPVKPPRTSLILANRSPTDLSTNRLGSESMCGGDSEDSDSLLSSRISTPPLSPITTTAPEKFALTRTLSSETNTSIASSTTSTLTSGSGSQASCSSMGSSTPIIDVSRRVLHRQSSNSTTVTPDEATLNRRNILASAKCRSGRDESSSLSLGKKTSRRYDDEDSTDGCDEEERDFIKKTPKPKARTSSSGSSNGFASSRNTLVNYKLAGKNDLNLVDKVINVASYVEVTSDVDELTPMDVDTVFLPEKETAMENVIIKVNKSKSIDDEIVCSTNGMNDLAKWVRQEANQSIINAQNKEQQQKKQQEAKVVPSVRSIDRKLSLGNNSTSAIGTAKPLPRSVSENIALFNDKKTLPATKTKGQNGDTKKIATSEIRKTFETKPNTIKPSLPIVASPKQEKNIGNSFHDRFSSLESIASSSSGVSSLQTGVTTSSSSMQSPSTTLQSTPEFGSFSSLGGSNPSLVTPQEIQSVIFDAMPALDPKTAEAFVVILHRETPESSIGITLAGGSDYEAKEITVHRILTKSPADKDGRIKKGDRILTINGLSMRGLTHRESVALLKTPRNEVVLIVTRSKSIILETSLSPAAGSPLSKQTKRPSLGSLNALDTNSSSYKQHGDTSMVSQRGHHMTSRSLDLEKISTEEVAQERDKETDNEEMANESMTNDESEVDDLIEDKESDTESQECEEIVTVDELHKVTNSCEYITQTMTVVQNVVQECDTNEFFIHKREIPCTPKKNNKLTSDGENKIENTQSVGNKSLKTIEVHKDGCGLGFSIEGGYDSPHGNKPLIVKKVFMGGAAERCGKIKAGDVIISINEKSIEQLTRVDVWRMMKDLPQGIVKIILID